MQAMILNKTRTPLECTELPDRTPGPGEIRIKVGACGVCRTDLHVLDGDLPDRSFPLFPGTNRWPDRIAGRRRRRVERGAACGCHGSAHLWSLPLLFGRAGEPLRSSTLHGLYARWWVRHGHHRRCALCISAGRCWRRCALAPLLCAGLIGWRSLVIAGAGKNLGLYGFGAAAHIIARWRSGREGRCMPSRDREIIPRKPLPAAWSSVGWRVG